MAHNISMIQQQIASNRLFRDKCHRDLLNGDSRLTRTGPWSRKGILGVDNQAVRIPRDTLSWNSFPEAMRTKMHQLPHRICSRSYVKENVLRMNPSYLYHKTLASFELVHPVLENGHSGVCCLILLDSMLVPGSSRGRSGLKPPVWEFPTWWISWRRSRYFRTQVRPSDCLSIHLRGSTKTLLHHVKYLSLLPWRSAPLCPRFYPWAVLFQRTDESF